MTGVRRLQQRGKRRAAMKARERRDLRRWLWLAAAGAGRLPRKNWVLQTALAIDEADDSNDEDNVPLAKLAPQAARHHSKRPGAPSSAKKEARR
ncbi:hypothetical protein GOBAR_DD02229 [Gossypium barbadense]|nr:hypothetical protein GOBAR_DD02229 [Gossypium barbadense]